MANNNVPQKLENISTSNVARSALANERSEFFCRSSSMTRIRLHQSIGEQQQHEDHHDTRGQQRHCNGEIEAYHSRDEPGP